MLARSEACSASALAWLGLVVGVVTASTFAILQVVHGIALKRAAILSNDAAAHDHGEEEERAIAFLVAEGIRWIEIGINSINRILQGAPTIIFGVAIAKSIFFLIEGSKYSGYLQVLLPLLPVYPCSVCRLFVESSSPRRSIDGDFLGLDSNPWYIYVERENG